ncbi:putative membrane protein [Shigella sonnei 4822-66]|nr:putative membrane protein [Shigella sonnei 4822-66]
MLKTIVISLTSLIIGTIASVLVTPLIFCLSTGAIISGVREAGANQA